MKDKHAVPVQQKGHICFHEESSSSNSYSGFSSLGDDHVFEGAGAGVDVPSGPASFTAAMPLRSIPVPASVTSPLGVATATSLNAEEGVVVPTEATVGVAGTNDVFAVDVSSKVHITDNILFGDECESLLLECRMRLLLLLWLLRRLMPLRNGWRKIMILMPQLLLTYLLKFRQKGLWVD
ncbi:hypothetical protein V6N12_063803 [Hibiscus sabdariffa]|uniref:Uncharacterized protein n=1 Tax=Hibiscus sabdariffa TaxID=183260 RepID=A0ABR2BCE8_9ROSI